ncbi:uncharacterized protein LOC122503393 isoform X2 [Leptopilina heterotoma]|uniref:uncharacterized protein LOC122503393 isoform X2 n=1 Tax=Leptopilina heterotoma TaxID=63436 RepID=UPI001CA83518|nr:uncharacterized protein LOC122503393 isoform X2 [Leptopilina heterotoma]
MHLRLPAVRDVRGWGLVSSVANKVGGFLYFTFTRVLSPHSTQTKALQSGDPGWGIILLASISRISTCREFDYKDNPDA